MKLHPFIKNLVSPKPQKKVGQLWHTADDFIIIIEKIINDDLIRVCTVNFAGVGDFVISGKKYKIGKDHQIIRETSCVLRAIDLTGYLLSLTEDDIKKWLSMPDECQHELAGEETRQRIVAEYLEQISPLRDKAIPW